MATYIILNAGVLILIILLMVVWRAHLPVGRVVTTVVFLLLMTAIFDSLIVSQGIVAYNKATILSLYIGRAPIEDFAYAIAAAMLVPYVWQRFSKHDR